ncbi:MAG: hypothetical protein ABSF38_05180 [Verrucomicrobiota bacterium]
MIAGAGAICAVIFFRPGHAAQNALEETCRELRQEGFKIDLAEFHLSASRGYLERADALLAANRSLTGALRSPGEYPNLMNPVGETLALVVWNRDWTGPYERGFSDGQEVGPLLRNSLSSNQAELDAGCEAALSGPIRFDLDALAGGAMLLPHVGALRNLSEAFATRAVVDLHDGDTDGAWTNLLACTRLVSAWEVEPVEISHLVWCTCATKAFDAAWQALQAHQWPEERLAQLQGEWERVDFFKGLADTEAFKRACAAASCQQERQSPAMAPGPALRWNMQSSMSSWEQLTYRWRQARYRDLGSYEDEKNFLVYFRDREVELQRAGQCRTWAEMRGMPGITNTVAFKSEYQSRARSALLMRQVYLSIQGQGQRLAGRAAEAEARRRLVIAAVALERYRVCHGAYPETLEKLVPEFLKEAPSDFMDGKPLRYHLMADGRFWLYSVGLDCIEDGGKMPQPGRGRVAWQPGAPAGGDLVWPLAASVAEGSAFIEAKQQQREALMQAALRADEERARQAEEQRQATVAELMAQIQHPAGLTAKSRVKEPAYHGKPLSQVIGNKAVMGHSRHSLEELLTVKQIITGEEPEVATFEVAVSYDVVTNIGELRLLVDTPLKASVERFDEPGEELACVRATNGNCLLTWNTTYYPPGQHVVRARLECEEGPDEEESIEVQGPLVAYYSSNLCQFDPAYDTFGPEGGTLYARLAESNGIYTIGIKSPGGEVVKTYKGTTSNGVIRQEWNLIDDQGRRYTNDSFDTLWDVTLPDSGRSQLVRGP